jgi:hypothetical protein
MTIELGDIKKKRQNGQLWYLLLRKAIAFNKKNKEWLAMCGDKKSKDWLAMCGDKKSKDWLAMCGDKKSKD